MVRSPRVAAVVLVLLALVGACRSREPAFCTDLGKVDKALGALRDAKAKDDFDRVPDLIDDVGDTYEVIAPPPILQDDWPAAVEFFRRQAQSARSLLDDGELPGVSEEDAARYERAFTNIADYGVARCGRVRGKLVP